MRNALLATQPYEVEKALRKVGENLRTARLRRNLTMEAVAARIGTGKRAVMDAEKGKASTGIATYAALLWAYDLLGAFEEMADPLRDAEGVALAAKRENKHASKTKGLDNDF